PLASLVHRLRGPHQRSGRRQRWRCSRSPDSRRPPSWRVLHAPSTIGSRRNGALRAGWG
ncbi:unnamed protein product, partial [Ascophyllum nodosum]